MAFPSTTTATTTGFSSSVTSMPVNLPASISAGDLLIAVVEVRNLGTWTIPSGWVQMAAPVSAGGTGGFTCFYKVADGTETSTATWTASTGTTASWQTRKITSWHGVTPPEIVTATSTGAVTNNNPPSITPTWGTDDNLYLAVMGNTAQAISITGAPTSYSDLVSNAVSSGGSACNTGTAYRQLNSASEDPAAFTTGTDRWWGCATIAIRPAWTGSGVQYLQSKPVFTGQITAGGTQVVTLDRPTTANDFIVVFIKSQNSSGSGGSITSVVDSKGNTVTHSKTGAAAFVSPTWNRLDTYTIPVVTGGAGHAITITVTGSNTSLEVLMLHYTNVDATTPIDALGSSSSGTFTTSTTISTVGSITTANANALVLVVGAVAANITSAAGTGGVTFKALVNNTSGIAAAALVFGDITEATTGTYLNATGVFTIASQPNYAHLISLKPASGSSAWTATPSDSVTPTEANAKIVNITKTDSETPTEQISSRPNLIKSESVSTAESAIRAVNRQPSDTATITEANAKTIGKNPPQITPDTSISGTFVTSPTFPQTVAYTMGTGVDSVLVVFVNYGFNLLSGVVAMSVTYGGQAMTLARGASGTATASEPTAQAYYLLNPPTGNNNIVVSNSNGTPLYIRISAVSFFNVHQVSALDVTAAFTQPSGTAPAVSIAPTVAGDAIVANATFISSSAAGVWSNPSGFTTVMLNSATTRFLGSAYLLNAPTGSQSIPWTLVGTQTSAAAGAVAVALRNNGDYAFTAEQISKSPRLTETESVSTAEAIIKAPNAIKSDSVTPSEANAKVVNRVSDDTATITEAAKRGVGLFETDSATATDSSTRAPGRNFTDSITTSEANSKLIGRKPSDAATASEASSKAAGLNKGDTATTSESSIRAPRKNLAESVTIADLVAKSVVVFKADTATIAISNAFQVGKHLIDTVTLSEQISALLRRSASDSVTVSEDIAKVIGKHLADSVGTADAATEQQNIGSRRNGDFFFFFPN